MTASAGGVDLLVMTGGIGEHSPVVRSDVVGPLAPLGLGVDAALNEAARSDADITGAGATARTVVVAASEDLEVARETEGALGR